MKRGAFFRLVAILLLQLIWWAVLPDSVKQRIELPLQDLLTRHFDTSQQRVDPRLAIIDIDEASLSAEGRWPWPRDTIALLIDQLHQHYQVLLIGSDIIFPDMSEQQDRLANSLTHAPVTTTLLWHAENVVRKGTWEGTVDCSPCESPPQAQGWITNTADLRTAQQAHITPQIDPDGLVRRLYPLVCHEHACIETLSLSLVRQLLDLPKHYSLTYRQLNDISGTLRLPLLPDGSYPISWNQPGGRVGYYSASDVLHQRLHTDALQGKVVIIGSTATGLHDLVPTPLATRYPAVEIHALLFQGILDQHHRQQPDDAVRITLIVSLLLTALLWLADTRQRLIHALPVLLLGSIAWIVWITLQHQQGLDWPITPPLVTSLLTLLLLLPLSLREQTRLREHLHQQFSAYVPPTVIEQLIQSPEAAIGIHPQRHFVTLLFADLRNFSRFSETRQPEELAQILRAIMDTLTEEVHRHGGTVDKYIGDAIMAFWGAPLPDPHHADHALQAAQAMCRCIDQFSYNNQILPLQLSVGINSGDVVVGDLGSSIRRSYTVCGSAVNIAAHLEEMTRQIEAPILVGKTTYQQAQQHYAWQPPKIFTLNAHTQEITAYPLDPFKASR